MNENENNVEVIDVEYTNDQPKSENQDVQVSEYAGRQTSEILSKEKLDETTVGDTFSTEMIPSISIEAEKIIEEEKYKDQEDVTTDKKRDTSFMAYDKERSTVEKVKRHSWISRITGFCMKLILVIVAFPFILLVGGGLLGITVAGFGLSLGAIAVGIGVIGFSAFILTASPGLFGWLGIFIALGMFSGGGLILCLMIVMFRVLKKAFKWTCGFRNKAVEEEE